jgi:hypothetical protein
MWGSSPLSASGMANGLEIIATSLRRGPMEGLAQTFSPCLLLPLG